MAFDTYPSFDELLRVPGHLYHNPTNLASEATWGTLLGYCETGVTWQPSPVFVPLTAEETGEEQTELVYAGAYPLLFAVLKNWNVTAIGRLFPGMADGKAVKFPGSYKPGKLLKASHGAPLLFVPSDQTNNPCLLLQQAVASLLETAKLIFSHRKDTLFPAVFRGFRKTDDADGISYMGLLSGAVLR